MVHWTPYRFTSLLPTLFCLLPLLSRTLADGQTSFDCHVRVSGAEFDLTKLDKEFIVNRTRKAPPTEMVDSLRFNLCADLERLKDAGDADQCSKSARACLTVENKKSGEPDRVISVVTLAEATSTFDTSASLADPKSLSIIFKGPEYPHPSNSTMITQMFNVKIRCDPDSQPMPNFIFYDGSTMSVELSGPAGCPVKSDSGTPPKDDKGDGGEDSRKEKVGSGIGWFFLVLLLAFAAYFCLGAYYNYSTYGARGIDLIPHRDFWQEVPYMLKDVISHLCSSVHSRRSSRGGYVAV